MQKVYLLLRNNQQTGPHSLEELLQLGIKPLDLVWVEGKSYGWSYPSEIDTLKPFVTITTSKKIELPAEQKETKPSNEKLQVPGKKIFVSLPVGNAFSSMPSSSAAPDMIEQKAEELRKRIQSWSPQNPSQEEEIKTNYTRSINDVEEDYTSWVFQKKTKKKRFLSKRNWIITGIIGVGLTGGWLIGKVVFREPAGRSMELVQKSSNNVPDAGVPEEKSTSDPVFVSKQQPLKPLSNSRATKKTKKKIAISPKTKTTVASQASTPEIVQKKEPGPTVENVPPIIEEKSEPTVAEAPKEKKKTLKQILGGLFKKNKKDETAQAEPKPAGTNSNERKATRRDEQATEISTVDLAEQVDIKLNKNSDDWMMGVQGLKITLYNRSTTTVNKAIVEVLYYSEQNSLLEKKTIQFSNIASKKSQTIAAPDHRLADHVEYKIISATGIEDAYAKQ
jgi:hypothetical protein